MNPGVKVSFSSTDFTRLGNSTHHIGGVIHVWGGFSLFVSTALETSLNSHLQFYLRGDSKANHIDEEDEPPWVRNWICCKEPGTISTDSFQGVWSWQSYL